jgi:hypothetical protein
LAERQDIALDRPSTIHAFCVSVLLQNGSVGEFPRPFRMADDWETDNIVEPSLARRLKIGRRDTDKLFVELAAASMVGRTVLARFTWDTLNHFIHPRGNDGRR